MATAHPLIAGHAVTQNHAGLSCECGRWRVFTVSVEGYRSYDAHIEREIRRAKVGKR